MTDLQPPPQQPWQPAPPPQQPYQPTPEPPKKNGQAIAGLIVAIIGLIGSAASSGVAVPVLFCLVGLGLGIAGIAVAKERRSGRGLATAAIIVACVGLIACLGHSSNRTSSSTTTTSAPSYSPPSYSAPATQPLPAGTYTGGTYVLGSDIQAGTYSTPGVATTGSILCGWWRLKDTTGDSSAIITGGNADGPTTITIKPSDGAIEFQGNCHWTKR